jgi:acetyl esterase/lipase
VTFPFRNVRSTLVTDVLYAAIRCAFNHITIAQSRYLSPSTTECYLAHCKNANITPQTLEVEGVAAHWIGSPDAEKVVLYLHGGGYTQPASPGYFRYTNRLVKDLNTQTGSRSFAVLFLAYTLAPEATHPTQLREAATILSHLITKTGRSPSDIFLSGDSAGANLVVAVLSHILHPHPEVPAVKLEQPLLGTLLYSPWVGFNTNARIYPSFDNEPFDIIAPLSLRKWSAMFLNKANPVDAEVDPGPVSGDAYTEVCLNDPAWWHGTHDVIGEMFVSYGGYEVLADPIRVWKNQLTTGWVEGGGDASNVVFLEVPKEAHVAPIFEVMAGSSQKSGTQVAIEEWYKLRLKD